jgi:hypothetical protein
VVKFCESHTIVVPNMDETYILRGGLAHRQPDYLTKERYYQVEI